MRWWSSLLSVSFIHSIILLWFSSIFVSVPACHTAAVQICCSGFESHVGNTVFFFLTVYVVLVYKWLGVMYPYLLDQCTKVPYSSFPRHVARRWPLHCENPGFVNFFKKEKTFYPISSIWLDISNKIVSNPLITNVYIAMSAVTQSLCWFQHQYLFIFISLYMCTLTT